MGRKAEINSIKYRYILKEIATDRIQRAKRNKLQIIELFQQLMLPVVQLERLKEDVIRRWLTTKHDSKDRCRKAAAQTRPKAKSVSRSQWHKLTHHKPTSNYQKNGRSTSRDVDPNKAEHALAQTNFAGHVSAEGDDEEDFTEFINSIRPLPNKEQGSKEHHSPVTKTKHTARYSFHGFRRNTNKCWSRHNDGGGGKNKGGENEKRYEFFKRPRYLQAKVASSSCAEKLCDTWNSSSDIRQRVAKEGTKRSDGAVGCSSTNIQHVNEAGCSRSEAANDKDADVRDIQPNASESTAKPDRVTTLVSARNTPEAAATAMYANNPTTSTGREGEISAGKYMDHLLTVFRDQSNDGVCKSVSATKADHKRQSNRRAQDKPAIARTSHHPPKPDRKASEDSSGVASNSSTVASQSVATTTRAPSADSDRAPNKSPTSACNSTGKAAKAADDCTSVCQNAANEKPDKKTLFGSSTSDAGDSGDEDRLQIDLGNNTLSPDNSWLSSPSATSAAGGKPGACCSSWKAKYERKKARGSCNIMCNETCQTDLLRSYSSSYDTQSSSPSATDSAGNQGKMKNINYGISENNSPVVNDGAILDENNAREQISLKPKTDNWVVDGYKSGLNTGSSETPPCCPEGSVVFPLHLRKTRRRSRVQAAPSGVSSGNHVAEDESKIHLPESAPVVCATETSGPMLQSLEQPVDKAGNLTVAELKIVDVVSLAEYVHRDAGVSNRSTEPFESDLPVPRTPHAISPTDQSHSITSRSQDKGTVSGERSEPLDLRIPPSTGIDPQVKSGQQLFNAEANNNICTCTSAESSDYLNHLRTSDQVKTDCAPFVAKLVLLQGQFPPTINNQNNLLPPGTAAEFAAEMNAVLISNQTTQPQGIAFPTTLAYPTEATEQVMAEPHKTLLPQVSPVCPTGEHLPNPAQTQYEMNLTLSTEQTTKLSNGTSLSEIPPTESMTGSVHNPVMRPCDLRAVPPTGQIAVQPNRAFTSLEHLPYPVMIQHEINSMHAKQHGVEQPNKLLFGEILAANKTSERLPNTGGNQSETHFTQQAPAQPFMTAQQDVPPAGTTTRCVQLNSPFNQKRETCLIHGREQLSGQPNRIAFPGMLPACTTTASLPHPADNHYELYQRQSTEQTAMLPNRTTLSSSLSSNTVHLTKTNETGRSSASDKYLKPGENFTPLTAPSAIPSIECLLHSLPVAKRSYQIPTLTSQTPYSTGPSSSNAMLTQSTSDNVCTLNESRVTTTTARTTAATDVPTAVPSSCSLFVSENCVTSSQHTNTEHPWAMLPTTVPGVLSVAMSTSPWSGHHVTTVLSPSVRQTSGTRSHLNALSTFNPATGGHLNPSQMPKTAFVGNHLPADQFIPQSNISRTKHPEGEPTRLASASGGQQARAVEGPPAMGMIGQSLNPRLISQTEPPIAVPRQNDGSVSGTPFYDYQMKNIISSQFNLKKPDPPAFNRVRQQSFLEPHRTRFRSSVRHRNASSYTPRRTKSTKQMPGARMREPRAGVRDITPFTITATTLAHISCNQCSMMARFLCSGCKRIAYCSQECQVIAWKEHRSNCVGHFMRHEKQHAEKQQCQINDAS